MQVQINGEFKTITDGLTLGELLVLCGYAQAELADFVVACNQSLVSRSNYDQIKLVDRVCVDIISVITGG